jgi:hypothetical protein
MRLDVLNPEQNVSSFGIEIVDVYSLTAPTTAKEEAAARVVWKAYEEIMAIKTSAAKVTAMKEQAAAEAKALGESGVVVPAAAY